MRLLIEGYKYDFSILKKLLPERYLSQVDSYKAYTDFVGYFNSSEKNGLVLILPKIFGFGNFVFGSVPIEELATGNSLMILRKYNKSKIEADFIYNFSLTLYLCLKEFIQRNPDTKIGSREKLRSITSNLNYFENSELDLVFSLLQFYRENRALISFKIKSKQAELGKCVSWNKTIGKTLPLIVDDNSPLYFNTIQKSKQINYEDELLWIFYSVLYKFKNEYGFKISIDEQYEIIKAKDFNDFERKALKVLKALKHRYFSDKLKRLYKLLYLYFEKKTESNSKMGLEEYVLSSNFNIVFEDMIDKLLSDTEGIDKLKYQSDGKIVDHIFAYESFFKPDRIYYVGDSKYYKETVPYSINTIYKQHTYAKNIIQYNINLFNSGFLSPGLRYRDHKTEGYNITPNFFIQAFVEHENFTDTADKFQNDTSERVKVNFQFKNRLFDRDSLIVHNFKINFLFVVKAYLTRDISQLSEFKAKTLAFIRTSILGYFQTNYSFYIVEAKDDIESFIQKHFRKLIGKIYSSSALDHKPNCIFLALDRNEDSVLENESILAAISLDASLHSVDLSAPSLPN